MSSHVVKLLHPAKIFSTVVALDVWKCSDRSCRSSPVTAMLVLGGGTATLTMLNRRVVPVVSPGPVATAPS